MTVTASRMISNRDVRQRVMWFQVPTLRALLCVCTSFLSRAAYSASIPSASGAREKTIWDSRHRASSLWCCFSAQSHGVSRFSFSANKSASLCTSNWGKTGGKHGFEQWNPRYNHQYVGNWVLGLNISWSSNPEMHSRVKLLHGTITLSGVSTSEKETSKNLRAKVVRNNCHCYNHLTPK